MGTIYNNLVEQLQLLTKTITANGTYNASSDNVDGYSQVTVNVPSLITIPCTFTWRTSGQLIPVNLSGYSYVIMKVRNVSVSSMSSYSKDIYICIPTNNTVVYSGWVDTHDAGGGTTYTGNVVSTFHANSNGVYIDSFSNSDTRAVYNSLSFSALYGIK